MAKNTDVSPQKINDLSGPIMDSIRMELAKYIEIEDEALLKANKAFDINLQYLFSTIILATALTFIFGLLTAFFFARLLWQRKKNIGHVKTEQTLVNQESLNDRLREANNVLRESEERLEVTLNSIGDAVIVTDANACVARLNPVARRADRMDARGSAWKAGSGYFRYNQSGNPQKGHDPGNGNP